MMTVMTLPGAPASARLCLLPPPPDSCLTAGRMREWPGMAEQDAARREFGQALEAHLDAMYGVALRLTRNGADAEDLVAEAATKAWSAFDTLADRDRFRPWILRIMRNHFISDFRKLAVRPGLVPLADADGEGEEGDLAALLNAQPDAFLRWWADPETEVANRLLGEQIMAAIAALPDAFREVVLLVNVDGLGYDEAAEVLGVPPGTIRSRMKRGRTLLQKALWAQALDAGLIPERETEA